MIIRSETASDVPAITEVTIAAFENVEVSHQTEQYIIEALRAAQVLTLSLVAEIDGQVVGHIAFSPVTISDGSRDWYGIGPLSVLPEYQRQGIGTALVQHGLSALKEMGARGCCLVGDPGYYKRFGFQSIPGLIYEGVPPEVFLALPFHSTIPQGFVIFHEGFMSVSEQDVTPTSNSQSE
jgi:putative acetyltransferase